MDEEIKKIFKRLENFRSNNFPKVFDMKKEGVRHALMFIFEENKKVTPGDISKKLGVSTARVAVIIRRLQEKGLIRKERDAKDGRKADIALTDEGKECVKKMKEKFVSDSVKIIETVGVERVNTFLDIAEEIKKAACDLRENVQ